MKTAKQRLILVGFAIVFIASVLNRLAGWSYSAAILARRSPLGEVAVDRERLRVVDDEEEEEDDEVTAEKINSKYLGEDDNGQLTSNAPQISESVNYDDAVVQPADVDDDGDHNDEKTTPLTTDDDATTPLTETKDEQIDDVEPTHDPLTTSSSLSPISRSTTLPRDHHYYYLIERGIALDAKLPPRRNVLFIKIPKSGGTTLAEVFSKNALLSGFRIPEPTGPFRNPNDTSRRVASVDTCTRTTVQKRENFEKFVRTHGGQLDLLDVHSCFNTFMAGPKYWSLGKRPLVITLMRDPWAQFFSMYRYVQFCCEEGKRDWCRSRCDLNFLEYVAKVCEEMGNHCNQQKRYLGGLSTEVQSSLSKYNLILTLENFDLGLAYMYVRFGVPRSFAGLPYVVAKNNTAVASGGGHHRILPAQMEFVKRVHLHVDYLHYNAAVRRFEAQMANLSPPEKARVHAVAAHLAAVKRDMGRLCGELNCSALRVGKCNHACFEEVVRRYIDNHPDLI